MNFRFTFTGSWCALLAAVVTTAAPASAVQSAAQSQPLRYDVAQRGADFKVMRSLRAVTNGVGQIVTVTNRYTVLGNGLNKQDAFGNWTECVPVVQSFPGAIVCTGATYRVILKTNLNRLGSVDFETSDGQRIVSHPLAVGYFDPESGRRVWLSAMSDCRAQVMSNKVVYARAFTNGGIEASVVYTYGVGRWHQDVVITKRPAVTPTDLGMGGKTRLEVATEIMQAPVPVKQTRVLKAEKNPLVRSQMAEPDLVDETLAFTARMRMPQGYALPDNSSLTNRQQRVPVAKRLRTMADGRTILFEAVEWRDVKAELEKLPRRFAGTAKSSDESLFATALPVIPAGVVEGASFEAQLKRAVKSGAVEIAAVTATVPTGFVLDYELLDSSLTTLTAGTYYIENDTYFSGLSYCSGVVIKFDNGNNTYSGVTRTLTVDSLNVDTGYAANGDLGSIVFTTMDDDTVGEIIGGSSGTPFINGAGLVFGGGDFGLGGICRYLDLGLTLQTTSPVTMTGWKFENSRVGLVLAESGNLTLENGFFLNCCSGLYQNSASSAVMRNTAFNGNQFIYNGINQSTTGDPNIFSCALAPFAATNGSTLSAVADYYSDCLSLHGSSFAPVSSLLLKWNSGEACWGNWSSATLGPVVDQLDASVSTLGIGGQTVTNLTVKYVDGTMSLISAPGIMTEEDQDGLTNSWELANFGNLNQTASGDYDGDGVSNAAEQTAGSDPNSVSFTTRFADLYVKQRTVAVTCAVAGGVPAYRAVLINDTNLAAATWTAYTSSNFSFTLPDADGNHNVIVALRGLTTNYPPATDFTELTLDRVAPVLTFTNPIVAGGAATVKKPYLQLQGFGNEPLASLTYDITNATNWRTNEFAAVVDQFFNTNLFDFTTNYFQAYDVALTNGLNKITLTVKDRAGNVTVTNLNVTLSYAGATNPPTLAVDWPPSGVAVSGDSFYVRGKINDETATLAAQLIGGGVTNDVEGIVERNGVFWVENLPLSAGTNGVTLTATDAAGNVTTTNFNVVKSTLAFAITSTPTGAALYDAHGTVSGTVGNTNSTVTVNGMVATVEADGSWTAANVPPQGLGTATYSAMATPASGPPSVVGTEIEMGAAIKVTKHTVLQTWTGQYFRDVWGKAFDAKYHAGFSGDLEPTYHGRAFSSSDFFMPGYGSSSSADYVWAHDNEPGTYHTSSGGGELPIPSGLEWLKIIPDRQVDQEPGWPYSGHYVYHYYAKGVRNLWTDGSSTVTVTAATQGTLYTGGKSQVKRRLAIHRLTADIGEYGMPEGHPLWEFTPESGVPSGAVKLMGKPVDSQYQIYLALPDGSQEVVSLKVAGKKHFNAIVSDEKFYLKHETVCAALTDPKLDRTSLGVGEEVVFGFDPPMTMAWPELPWWMVLGGGTVSPTLGSGTLFTAPDHRVERNTVRVKVRDVQLDVDFSVLEPSGVIFTNLFNWPESEYPARLGAGMVVEYTVQPDNVSFSKVWVWEVSGPPSYVCGFFEDIAINRLYHLGSGERIPCNNTEDDNVGFKPALPLPDWSYGQCEYSVPWMWKIYGTVNSGKKFADVLMVTVIDGSDGTVTSTKGEATVTRTPPPL